MMTSSMGGGAPGGGRGSRRARRGGLRPMAEINVTPFVDVMMVLLIIFMVAAPLLSAGVPITLPETAASPLPQENEPPLELSMAADGTLIVQEQPVAREALIPLLRAVAAERNDDKIFLRADAALSYGAVAEVMGALNASGFRNIGLVTDGGGPTLDGAEPGTGE